MVFHRLFRVMRCIGHEVARATPLPICHPAPCTRQLLEISSYRVELIIEIGNVNLLERPAQLALITARATILALLN